LLRDKKFWIGLAISVVFLYLAFRGEDLGAIGAALTRVQYWALIPAIVAYFVGVWLRAIRWGVLLSPMRQGIHPYRLFKVLVIGYMGNDILPARLGDVIRVYVLSRRENVTKSATLATILVERIFDGLTMLGFLAASALFITLNTELTLILRAATSLFLAGFLVFLFLAAAPDRISTLVRLILGRSPIGRVIPESLHERALHMTSAFVGGLAVLRSWRGVLSVMGLSIGAWAAEALMYYIIGAWGFGLDLPVHAYTITTAIANLSTLVPSSPGYFGVFDTVAKVVLVGLFKLDSTMALSYVALLHAALYFPVTLWGVYYMVRESVSWSELAALEKKEAAGQPAVEEDDSGANARGGSEGSGEMLSVPVGGAPAGVRAGERDTAQSGPR
jgi:glycosyltransferase 2 family protein